MDSVNGLNSEDIFQLGATLLASSDVGSRAVLLAEAVQHFLPDSACILYRLKPQEAAGFWVPLAVAGDVALAATFLEDAPRIFPQSSTPDLLYDARQLRREDYAHLLMTKTIRTIGYVPFEHKGALAGVFEVLAFGEEFAPQQLEALKPFAQLASVALITAEDEQQQKHDLLDSIHRLTQLYDLEKSLNATLEFDALIELIPVKVALMIPCQAVHLWMFDGDDLRLMSRHGSDPTIEAGAVAKPGENYVGDMAEEGEPLLIDDPGDPRLTQRNGEYTGDDPPPIYTALMVPLLQDGSEVGVLETINRAGGPFDDDDLFFLNTMAETVSSALKNASLLLTERKLEILEALVHVSSEITSTLRLERLLQIIVNSPQSVLPFERCAIALDLRGRLQLRAISGMANIPAGDVEVERLRNLLNWLSKRYEPLLVRQQGDEPGHDDEDVRVFLKRHFEESGNRAIFALPLSDDQGRVGLLLYESSDPDFLETAHVEMIKVLAGQATVAMRNALLYREVPLIHFLEPLMQRKQKFLRSDSRRRAVWLGGAVAALVFLTLVPLPLRLSGTATVGPQHIVTVAAPVAGNVTQVFAREGERVASGQVLGGMDDWLWKTELASAQAKYQSAVLAMEADLAQRSQRAGQDRAQADYLQTQLQQARQRFVSAGLRSSIDGIVVTPDLQNAAGEHLDAGAAFAQVLDLSSAVVNIAIDEEDAPLLQQGQKAAIKLNSFPTRTWRGEVAIISPEAQPGDGQRLFYARVPLDNHSAELRSGMQGRAKIFAGFHPAGFVLLRRPALWAWQLLWNWIGW